MRATLKDRMHREMRTRTTRLRYPEALLGAFSVIFVALGVAPSYRQDWLLENVLVFAALACLVTTHRRLRFSNVSYTLLFVFFVLHEIGAHYTYSLVPYDSWLAKVVGRRWRRDSICSAITTIDWSIFRTEFCCSCQQLSCSGSRTSGSRCTASVGCTEGTQAYVSQFGRSLRQPRSSRSRER